MSDEDPPSPSYPGVDQPSCQLLGPTALVVQALMGVLVILSLVYKRQRESPKRPWRIWLFDVSKQVVGQMFVHGFNVLISHIISVGTSSNACVTYFLNILIDTTLGIALIYFTLHFLTYLFTEKFNLKGFESGVYGTPPSFNYWCRQATLYVLSLTTMKVLVVGLLALFPGIFQLGEWLLSWTWTEEGDALQVIFTMGIFPIVMNVLQFWLIDSIVKASTGTSVALDAGTPDSLHAQDREPLFRAPSDDEDDNGYRPHDIENRHTSSRNHRKSSIESDQQSQNSYTLAGSTPENKTGTNSVSEMDQEREMHSYPPSLSSSLTSDSSSTYLRNTQVAPKPAKNLMKKKRRGPPAPLNIQPVRQPAVNSPQPRTPSPNPPAKVEPPKHEEEEDWGENWEEDGDWEAKGASRVGEGRTGLQRIA